MTLKPGDLDEMVLALSQANRRFSSVQPLLAADQKSPMNVLGIIPARYASTRFPGKPVRGFTRKDCHPASDDALATPVRWQQPLRAIAGKPVRPEFFLKKAQLFSFYLEGSHGR